MSSPLMPFRPRLEKKTSKAHQQATVTLSEAGLVFCYPDKAPEIINSERKNLIWAHSFRASAYGQVALLSLDL